MNLTTALEGKAYTIQRIETDDEALDAFLFSLGCYSGEPITVVSRLKGGCVVSIKDGRYNIDKLSLSKDPGSRSKGDPLIAFPQALAKRP